MNAVSPTGHSSTRSRLQSCAIGCGAFLVLAIVAAVSLYYWAVTPGRQVPTDFILGADSLALMHVEGLQDDPGLRAMIEKLISDIQAAQARRVRRENIPWFLKMLVARERDITDRELDKTLEGFPRDLTVTLEDVPGASEPRIAVAVNLNRYPRVLRLIFSLASLYQDSETFQGNRLLRLGRRDEGVVTFVEHTALWAQSADTLRLVLMRRAEAMEGAGGTRVLEAYNSRDQRWNLYGVIENVEGTLAWMLSRAFQESRAEVSPDGLEELLSPVVRVHFGIDVVNEDAVEAQIDVDCRSEDEARDLAKLAEESIDEALSAREFGNLKLERQVHTTGKKIILSLVVQNIREEIVSRIEKAERR